MQTLMKTAPNAPEQGTKSEHPLCGERPLWQHLTPEEVRAQTPEILAKIRDQLVALGSIAMAIEVKKLEAKSRVRFRRASPFAFIELADGVSSASAADGDDVRQKAQPMLLDLLALAGAFGDEAAQTAIATLLFISEKSHLERNGENEVAYDAWLTFPSNETALQDGETVTQQVLAKWLSSHHVGLNGASYTPTLKTAEVGTLIVAPDMADIEQDSDSFFTRDADAHLRRFKALAEPLPLKGNFDIDGEGRFELITQLLAEFPWFSEVILAIEEQMILRHAMGQENLGFGPLLLVGPPGCGKTRFAMRLAALSGCGYGAVNAGGSSDNRLLAGTARGWATAMPCLPASLILQSKSANPVVVVDEIDKTSTDPRNGRLVHTLLSMLEPTSARAWPDECLITPLNLSRVNWIVTANVIEELEGPLLSRLDVFHIRPPSARHFDALLAGVLSDIAMEFGQSVEDLPMLTNEVRSALRAMFESAPSPRALRRATARALAQSLRPEKLSLN